MKSDKKKQESMIKELHSELQSALEAGEALHREVAEADARIVVATNSLTSIEARAKASEKALDEQRNALVAAEESEKVWEGPPRPCIFNRDDHRSTLQRCASKSRSQGEDGLDL